MSWMLPRLLFNRSLSAARFPNFFQSAKHCKPNRYIHYIPTSNSPIATPISTSSPATDTAAFKAKMGSIEQIKGFSQSLHSLRGASLLQEPAANKGTSFTPKERDAKNLTGLLPQAVEPQDLQVARVMSVVNSRTTNIDKYLYLSALKSTNTDLFYRVVIDNIAALLPLVYTPTIGDVCLQYSSLFTRPEALYISINQRKEIRTILRNWHYPDPSICVVTDGSRILGLGDLGINGVGIPIGKLALYVGAAGIHPDKTLPIVLDYGTANEGNLKDPFYLGLRQPRVSPEEAAIFMDEFMEAVEDVYPEMLVQFEDFSTEKAFGYLEKYKHRKMFNDDIQGTGAVILAGYMGAVELSNVPLEDQRVVFMGAGSAGVGVANQMTEYYTRKGFTLAEARAKFYLVDTKGLVTFDRGDKLAEHKKTFARSDNNGKQCLTLEEVIEHIKPSALVGLTASHGIFNEKICKALVRSVDSRGPGRRAILFPLSNPLTKAECTFEEATKWVQDRVIFAAGSPFQPITLGSKTYYPNQGNNVYVFPGLGLGAILAKAARVTDDMVYQSAAALAGALKPEEVALGLIYPKIERVRESSIVVAREVMKSARRGGVSKISDSQWAQWEKAGDAALDAWIKTQVYDPKL